MFSSIHSIRATGHRAALVAGLLVLLLAFAGHANTPITKIEPSVAPNLSFVNGAGQALNLEQFRGKVVVVNLWAPWCAPCLKEMPSLLSFAQKNHSKGVVVLPVTIGQYDPTAIQEFYTKLGIEALPIYIDGEHSFVRAFGAKGLPTSIIIDRSGKQVAQIHGATDWGSVEVTAFMRFLTNS